MSHAAAIVGFNDFSEDIQTAGIILKSYTEVGEVLCPGTGSVKFTSTEIIALDGQKPDYFVNIEVERLHQHPLTGSVLLPYDEIERTMRGIMALIKGGQRGLNRMKHFEAIFTSADGNLRIIIFNNHIGKIMSSLQASGAALYFENVAQLGAVAEKLARAKEEIDRIKII